MPEIFGLHDNANITFAQNETFALFGAILQLQPKSSSMGGQSREEVGSRKGEGPKSGQSQAALSCLHLGVQLDYNLAMAKSSQPCPLMSLCPCS